MLDVLTVPLQAEGTHNGSTSCADAQGNVPVKKVAMRLAALDIVRGFTVAVMIFVDDAGDSLQHINHAPWHGLNLADIVMPWFLFMVGNAMAFSLKITTGSGRCAQLQKLIIRAVKLFLLGLVLQGGGLPEATWETWGFNLATIRWCGILQRVPDAVLWLLTWNATVKDNLLAAARERGIAEDRLLFAPLLPHEQHMQRLDPQAVAVARRARLLAHVRVQPLLDPR
jgi:hypothetical protein